MKIELEKEEIEFLKDWLESYYEAILDREEAIEAIEKVTLKYKDPLTVLHDTKDEKAQILEGKEMVKKIIDKLEGE